jgi:hypothetical protein
VQPTLGGALFRALAQRVRGALGIFTPHVDTAAEAREVVNRLKARNAVAWRRKGGSVGVPIGGDRDPPRMPQCVKADQRRGPLLNEIPDDGPFCSWLFAASGSP